MDKYRQEELQEALEALRGIKVHGMEKAEFSLFCKDGLGHCACEFDEFVNCKAEDSEACKVCQEKADAEEWKKCGFSDDSDVIRVGYCSDIGNTGVLLEVTDLSALEIVSSIMSDIKRIMRENESVALRNRLDRIKEEAEEEKLQ